jgi:hypothetical protein
MRNTLFSGGTWPDASLIVAKETMPSSRRFLPTSSSDRTTEHAALLRIQS